MGWNLLAGLWRTTGRTGSLTEKPMVTNERGAVIITGLKSNCQTEISGESSSSFRLLTNHMWVYAVKDPINAVLVCLCLCACVQGTRRC